MTLVIMPLFCFLGASQGIAGQSSGGFDSDEFDPEWIAEAGEEKTGRQRRFVGLSDFGGILDERPLHRLGHSKAA